LPIILVVMVAKWVGDYFSHSIYERLIQLKGLPFLENNPPKECAILGVTEVMQNHVVTFREIEKVDTILKVNTQNN
jgi:chloride channel 7